MKHRYGASVKAALAGICLTAVLPAATMPAAQQNAVVQKYCGSCHSDALMYGGLSVQHFDAAHSEPSLAAMLLSKITNGHTPQDVIAAAHGPDPDAAILRMMKNSAMGAAGNGVPDEITQVAFAKSLSEQAAGADQWDSRSSDKPQTFTAAILREALSTKFPGLTDMYRLILTCRTATHEGEIKLAWANGVPEEGRQITVAVDGNAPFPHKVEGGKKQGNGANGPGATILYPNPTTNVPLPTQSLTISNLFPNETVVFPFETLSPAVQQDLSSCFAPGAITSATLHP
jgi:hypothetical protein